MRELYNDTQYVTDNDAMNVTYSESVNNTQYATPCIHPLITKDECRNMSDSDLLHMVNNATGHTGKDFGEYMNCDFSYSFLTGELQKRGYINDWHKVTNDDNDNKDITYINMQKSKNETVRQAFLIDKEINDKWKQFNQNIPYKTVTINNALSRFMDDYKKGLIIFTIDV